MLSYKIHSDLNFVHFAWILFCAEAFGNERRLLKSRITFSPHVRLCKWKSHTVIFSCCHNIYQILIQWFLTAQYILFSRVLSRWLKTLFLLGRQSFQVAFFPFSLFFFLFFYCHDFSLNLLMMPSCTPAIKRNLTGRYCRFLWFLYLCSTAFTIHPNLH